MRTIQKMRYLRKQIDRSLIAHGKRLDCRRKACVLFALLMFGRYGDGSYTDEVDTALSFEEEVMEDLK